MQIKAATRQLSSILSKPRLHFPQPIRAMSSLSYTPERAAELKENIDGVLAEVRSAGTEKVSSLHSSGALDPILKLTRIPYVYSLDLLLSRRFVSGRWDEKALFDEEGRKTELTFASLPFLLSFVTRPLHRSSLRPISWLSTTLDIVTLERTTSRSSPIRLRR